MKSYRIFRLISVVLVVSLFPFYVFADEEYEDGRRNEEYIEETQIDESVNQSLIDYLESLENQEPAPSESRTSPEQYSYDEFVGGISLEESDDDHNVRPKEGWRDQFDTVDPPRTDPSGFFSVGSDIYYTDPVSGVRYCNTTLTYEHIIFTFGADYKVTSIAPQDAYASNRCVKVLLEAFSHIGAPSTLEATPSASFACGSFVSYVYFTALGVWQKWSSDQQVLYFDLDAFETVNGSVGATHQYLDDESDLLPGDLIYWYNPACAENNHNCPLLEGCRHYKGVHHTAIYIGNGQVIESVSNNSINCVVVGDIRQMNGLQIYGYVRLINEDVTLPAVTGVATRPAGKYKVTVEWPANKYTDGYLVYSRKNEVYSYCGMTREKIDIDPDPDDDVEVLVSRFTDANALSSGNGYYVFPYVTDYSGTMYPGAVSVMVTGEGICLPVENLGLTQNNGSITLHWDANPEADGYLIYGYHNGGPYGLIGSKNGRDNTTFIDSTASSTITSYYWVFAFYRENGNVIPGLAAGPVSGTSLLHI